MTITNTQAGRLIEVLENSAEHAISDNRQLLLAQIMRCLDMLAPQAPLAALRLAKLKEDWAYQQRYNQRQRK